MAILNNSNAISSGGYDVNNSLRFRSSASAYLNRTPASAGNRKTYTWSGWVKRGNLTTNQNIFSAGYTTGTFDANYLQFTSSNTLSFQNVSGGSGAGQLATSAVFRDPSAWYHIVVAVDTTQATASDRAKLYVNGVQQTVTFTSNFTLNADTQVNNTSVHSLGRIPPDGFGGAAWEYLDGYLADVNFIDGQALTPSSFGETDTTTGSWKPKAYSGTYGTNGFYLKFSDIATTSGSNAGLGKDFSGNANYWTTNNISVTAGTTYDAMLDSPTLTSATVANYATWNPLINGDSATSGNLNVTNDTARGTQELLKYDAYWEITSTGGTTTAGVVSGTGTTNTTTVADTKTYGFRLTTTGTLDYINITDGGSFTNITTGLTSQQFPYASAASATTGSFNAGQRPFAATPPSGFKALNTFNLPDSTIKKGNTVMDATIYTGTGASLSVTNAGAFKPDFVWVKGRSGATDHALYDSVRGTTIDLVSNSTAAETTQAQGLTAFGTGGFTVGTLSKMNTSAATYVGWQWQAGQGTTSSNTSGSITSTVSVNATAGFSVVTFTKTGTGTVKTVGHGLGVAPSFIVAKVRNDVDNWLVYHISNGATFYQELNTTIAKTSSDPWGNTTPTSTVFSTKDNGTSNFVAYCWAEIAGYSKFGSYTGNGSTDGPFVYLGFRPKWILIKSSSGVSSWILQDTSRNIYNAAPNRLFPNTSDAEGTSSAGDIDILSNGFKIRNTSGSWNANGEIYIYMAFAENPFKNALAR